MLAIVRIALSRPYTFVVMAMLILIFGISSWFKTPTDIFPNIGIPVVAAVWSYNGLPPEAMSGRIVYYYERTLSSQVNDIEHIESQSLAGYGVVKIFFQPSVNINTALAQVTAASQTVLKLLPPGVTPPYVLLFNASTVPIIQLALSSASLSQAQLADDGQNFIRPQLATMPGAAVPSPYGGKVRQVHVDLNPTRCRPTGSVRPGRRGRARAAESDHARRHAEDRHVRIHVDLNDAPTERSKLKPARQERGRHGRLHARRRARARRQPAADQHRACRRHAGRADDHPQGRLGLDARHHRRRQGAAAADPRQPADEPEPDGRRRSIDLRHDGRVGRDARGRDRGRAHRPDDPAVSRQLALHADHHDVDPARDPVFLDDAVGARRDDQRHDARRAGAGRRHSGRRRAR